MKNKLPITEKLLTLKLSLDLLENNLSPVMRQPFWLHKVQMKEKLEYLDFLATRKATLFTEAQKEYPELQGKIYAISTTVIKIEAEDVEELIEAN